MYKIKSNKDLFDRASKLKKDSMLRKLLMGAVQNTMDITEEYAQDFIVDIHTATGSYRGLLDDEFKEASLLATEVIQHIKSSKNSKEKSPPVESTYIRGGDWALLRAPDEDVTEPCFIMDVPDCYGPENTLTGSRESITVSKRVLMEIAQRLTEKEEK